MNSTLVTILWVVGVWIAMYIIFRVVRGIVKNKRVDNPYGLRNPSKPYG